MRMVFEEDIEKCDYLEFIVTKREANRIIQGGVDWDFPLGLFGKRNLNVFIRLEEVWEQQDAISKREGREV